MMRNFVVSFLFSFLAIGIVQAETMSLEEVNKLYAAEKYIEAAAQYEDMIATQGVAPELYYNLANAYFKMNELGKAILNYERALRLSPAYADAKFNLEFANQRVIDNIVLADTFFLKKWWQASIKFFNTNTWFIIAAISFILALTALLLFLFGHTKTLRKLSFYISLILLIVSIFSIFCSKQQLNYMQDHREAIIMTGAVVIKGSPHQGGTELFELHEGTKVCVESELDGWYEIKLTNGNIGWVENHHIEKI